MLLLSELQACLASRNYRVYIGDNLVERIAVKYQKGLKHLPEYHIKIHTGGLEDFIFPEQELRNGDPGIENAMSFQVERVDGVKMLLCVTVEAVADLNSWLFQFKQGN